MRNKIQRDCCYSYIYIQKWFHIIKFKLNKGTSQGTKHTGTWFEKKNQNCVNINNFLMICRLNSYHYECLGTENFPSFEDEILAFLYYVSRWQSFI